MAAVKKQFGIDFPCLGKSIPLVTKFFVVFSSLRENNGNPEFVMDDEKASISLWRSYHVLFTERRGKNRLFFNFAQGMMPRA